MLEDAVGVLGAGDEIAVRDVAELLAQSVGVGDEAAMGVAVLSAGRITDG
jgi:hypothetical protein